jgi:hypothetical protein
MSCLHEAEDFLRANLSAPAAAKDMEEHSFPCRETAIGKQCGPAIGRRCSGSSNSSASAPAIKLPEDEGCHGHPHREA